MRLFLTILEGESPLDARPLIATEDTAVIQAAVRELLARLGGKKLPAQILRLVPEGDDPVED